MEAPVLTVIMPVLNERRTIRLALERLLKADLPSLEVIIVDDGSSDGSAEQISEFVDGERVKLIRHVRNAGKGAALRSGIGAATGEFISVLDADLEYDPQDFKPLLAPLIAGESTVVYGIRSFGSNTAYSFWYVLGNRFLAFWASFLFNTWLSDLETCLKVTTASVWRTANLKSPGFGVEAEVTAKFLLHGHKVHQIPITYKARDRSEGKKLTWTDGIQALWILTRVRLTGR